MRDFLSFLLTSFHGWLTSVRDYIDNWLGGGGGTPTTPTGETITVGDRAGLFEAGEGNDTITSTHSASDVDFRLTGDSTIQRDDDFAEHGWWYGPMSAWNPTHAIPAVGLMPGLLVLRGGAGNDSITATGNATDAYGGTGDDIVTVHGLASVGTHMGMVARGAAGNDTIIATGTDVVAAGGGGDDTLRATGTSMNVNGGIGNDYLVLSGSDMTVSGGEGVDTIDATNLTSGWIRLDQDDVLIWDENSTGDLHIFREGTTLSGNDAGEYFLSTGANEFNGMGGNDTLQVQRGNSLPSTLLGGTGVDVIDGNRARDDPDDARYDSFYEYYGNTSDVLDGGAGNDRITFDRADTVTGGAGADRLTGFLDRRSDLLSLPTITDFNPDGDSLLLNVNTGVWVDEDLGLRADKFTFVRQGDSTVMQIDGQDVLRIDSTTDEDLAIGYQIDLLHVTNAGGSSYIHIDPYYTDLNGNQVDRASLDVIINGYEGS